jgi:nitrilase
VLAGPLYDAEGILYADLDRDGLTHARFDFHVVGHYSRPDVFRLVVNESRQTGVVVQTASEVPVREGERT